LLAGPQLDRPPSGPYNPRMFGLSLPKLIVLLVVCGAVWYGIKYLQLRDRQRARSAERAAADSAARAGPRRPPEPAAVTEELVKCRICATYVAPGAARCGRADCPNAAG
jgi:hypothetical protein